MKNKIVITTSSFAEYDKQPLNILKETYDQVELNPYGRKLTKDELIDFAQDATGIIAGTENYSGDVLEKLPKLKVLSRCGTGMDNVDISAANEKGIIVCNTPDAPTLPVAELTIGLMLDLLRNISISNSNVKNSNWLKHMGRLLQGKRVGIIGYGRIGKKVAELLLAFEAEVAYYDLFTHNKAPISYMSLDELLEWADIITLHCNASKTGEYLLGEKELKKMKRDAMIINTARGELIDEEALYATLINNQYFSAALDVFAEEPYNGKLIELPNIIVTPHIGSYARESRVAMEIEAVHNLCKGLINL
ncbi:hypothetical protein BHU72_05275 [Desulfuribacillus stibiiarsenatis]|uniref:Hydroxyacid dehydrogenase n=1 Tax=Desulfuribacillus stibiiarsenatis TaxID=1390249 RepID=A0A1E5L638_9FIRM|nr:phosphoglycerate dehydrogenase [Desulfuribacillus stibiiarsenatis]OEH85498.1 hypothetical protein BHU72_05275 [Desulfuribacillus stibiiarsenatis]